MLIADIQVHMSFRRTLNHVSPAIPRFSVNIILSVHNKTKRHNLYVGDLNDKYYIFII